MMGITIFSSGEVYCLVCFTVGNYVLGLCCCIPVNKISDHKTDDIPRQMKILNTVIP